MGLVKIGGQDKRRPEPAADSVGSLHYEGSEDKRVAEGEESSGAKAAEDAGVYGAAGLAADFYGDERHARFEQKSADCAAELTAQGIADAFAGPMSVAPVAAGEDY